MNNKNRLFIAGGIVFVLALVVVYLNFFRDTAGADPQAVKQAAAISEQTQAAEAAAPPAPTGKVVAPAIGKGQPAR